MTPRQFLPFIALLALVAACATSSAHEVDHYNLPTDCELVDVGDYWNELLFGAVRDAVEDLNDDIHRAQRIPVVAVRTRALEHLHRETTVAWCVRKQLPTGWGAIERAEIALRGRVPNDDPTKPEVRRKYKASPLATTFSHVPLVPDPRQFNRALVLRCSLVNVHGTYMGTDKIGHFVAMGYWYYLAYQASLAIGTSPDTAMHNACRFGEWGPISEWGIVGGIPTGIYSNADMAANYCGMKFFINLTRPVKLQGCEFPPMLVRDGDFWRLAPHVHPDGPFFGMFVSDHFDEVLNPSVCDWTIRSQLRRRARDYRAQLLAHYQGNDPRKFGRPHVERRTGACSTYFGEEYGHVGSGRQLITLGDVCFPNDSGLADPWEASSNVLTAEVDHPDRDRLRLSMPWTPSKPTGGPQNYGISITNTGEKACRNVRVALALPKDQVITAVEQPAGFDAETYTLTWLIPLVETGSEVMLRYQAVLTAPKVESNSYGVYTVAYAGEPMPQSADSPPENTMKLQRPAVVFDPSRFLKTPQ